MNGTRFVVASALIGALAFGGAAGADDIEQMFDAAATTSAADKAKPGNALVDLLNSQIPKPSPEQSAFIAAVGAGEWQKALLQYSGAFEKTQFQKSENGRALYALAHFKAGMPIAGLETLFRTVKTPSQIHPEIRKQWRDAAPETNPIWSLANIKWAPGFAEVFTPEVENRVLLRELAAKQDIPGLTKLYARLPSNSEARARVGWQLVISHSLVDDIPSAAKVLAELFKSKSVPISQDLMNLTAARLLYQKAQYQAAIRYYEKIPKKSEYWTDAQEEMAWAYVRRGEPGNAIALSESLVTPAMAMQTGPESFFVYSLALLKVCDYPTVINTLQEFPRRYKARSEALTKVAKGEGGTEVKAVINELKKQKVSRIKLGANGRSLPRLVANDDKLFSLAQAQKHLEAEAKAADLIYAQSLAETGLQGYFDSLRQDIATRAGSINEAALLRVSELANLEVKEIKEILRKLHIVEAEVIQQVSLAERVVDKSRAVATEKKGVTGSKARDVLVFPADKEVWFDEIGNYRVNVKKACHAAKEKST